MNTQDFRTKTMIVERANVSSPEMWGVAVDIGYSGVKLFSPNIIACFPAFAVPARGERLNITTENTKNTILFRKDANSQVWLVGKAAQDSISKDDPDTSSMSIFGRQRYNSDMFRVLADTALGLACTKNQYGDPTNKPVVLKSGLPNAYIKVDSPALREVFEGLAQRDGSIMRSLLFMGMFLLCRSQWEHFFLSQLEMTERCVQRQISIIRRLR